MTRATWICALMLGMACFCAPLRGETGGPRAGDAILLVASPDLLDPNFSETVVLVTRYRGIAGPLGVILNRPTPSPLSRAIPGVTALAALDDKVYFGGPVARRALFYVFRAQVKPDDAIEVAPGVYLDWDHERLRGLLDRDKPTEGLRIYAGHAAWAPGQLETEVARGLWKSARPEARLLFSDKPEALWGELVHLTRVRLSAAP